jgi:hypothetical protein
MCGLCRIPDPEWLDAQAAEIERLGNEVADRRLVTSSLRDQMHMWHERAIRAERTIAECGCQSVEGWEAHDRFRALEAERDALAAQVQRVRDLCESHDQRLEFSADWVLAALDGEAQ